MAEVKEFTQREMEIMAKAWSCMTEEPKVNYDKLALSCGMTNPRSASNAWAAIKKKIMARGGIVKVAGEEPNVTPKSTTKKRGRKAAAAVKEDAEDESPTKKAKGKKSKAPSKVQVPDPDEESGLEDAEGEEVEDGVQVKAEGEEKEVEDEVPAKAGGEEEEADDGATVKTEGEGKEKYEFDFAWST